MDLAAIIALVLVAAALVGAVIYLRGPRRERLDMLGQNPAARAVRTGEDSPGQSADSAALGTRERPSTPGRPDVDVERPPRPKHGPPGGRAP